MGRHDGGLATPCGGRRDAVVRPVLTRPAGERSLRTADQSGTGAQAEVAVTIRSADGDDDGDDDGQGATSGSAP
ncbi:hypothetical protein DY240_21265 [Jiangella rhizosphaerae]|uniref:Uncharacterized protein n=1 Tax=Jiangella rhizosphaerae TaxID=2293569 RepID=A0A418KLH9_9ACTN|nr:hypothetical protein DY240_21265 [Jiangella rhizosphaerae]